MGLQFTNQVLYTIRETKIELITLIKFRRLEVDRI